MTERSGSVWRIVVAALLLLGLALVVSEAGMQADPGKRLQLYGVFAASVVLTGLLGWWLVRAHRRWRSLRWTLLAVGGGAVVVAGGVVAASTRAMFVETSDMRLVVAALLLGGSLGLLVAISVTGPLTRDLRHLAETAGRVADGDLAVRAHLHRGDEVGDLGRSLDRMVEHLAGLEHDREQATAARQRLLAAIGHDLRTPLASLQAAAEALQDGVAADPDRYLRTMGADIQLLRGMVDDLFVLVRLEAGEDILDRIPLDLSEIVDGAAESMEPVAARDGVAVALDGDGHIPVIGDAQALSRVVRNLLDNAIRHAPDGSAVTVSTSADNGWATVRVRDHGPGFPSAFVESAFDLFSRADAARERRGGGAGLGLAIAREFVDAHGGTIWIDPAPPTTVVFRLPVDGGIHERS